MLVQSCEASLNRARSVRIRRRVSLHCWQGIGPFNGRFHNVPACARSRVVSTARWQQIVRRENKHLLFKRETGPSATSPRLKRKLEQFGQPVSNDCVESCSCVVPSGRNWLLILTYASLLINLKTLYSAIRQMIRYEHNLAVFCGNIWQFHWRDTAKGASRW